MKNTFGRKNVFDEMGIYWMEIADANSTENQIEFIKTIIEKEGWILDLACGTGRHSILLSKLNYRMIGLDNSLTLLTVAKNRCFRLQVVRGDMRFLPFKSSVFSAAISIDNSIGYLPLEKDDLQSLKEVNKTLRDNGAFLIDIFNKGHIIRKYSDKAIRQFTVELNSQIFLYLFIPTVLFKKLFGFLKWKEYPSFFLYQKRTVRKKGEKLFDLWIIYDKSSGLIKVFQHVVRLYDFNKLRNLIERAGFIIKKTYGDYQSQKFSIDSKRLIVMVSKK